MTENSEKPTILYYHQNPKSRHLLGFPVVSLYLIDLMVALFFKSEVIALLTLLIGFFHVVAVLFTYWSVKFRAFTGFTQVNLATVAKKSDEKIDGNALRGVVTHVMAIPPQHLGKPELVSVSYREKKEPFFMFQKVSFFLSFSFFP